MTVKIYHNPKCSKSRQVLDLIKNKGIAPEMVLYLEKRLSFAEVEEILQMLKLRPRDIMRKGEEEYKNFADLNLSDHDLIAAIVENPKLLERPIVVNGNKAAIGRPPENVLGIL